MNDLLQEEVIWPKVGPVFKLLDTATMGIYVDGKLVKVWHNLSQVTDFLDWLEQNCYKACAECHYKFCSA